MISMNGIDKNGSNNSALNMEKNSSLNLSKASKSLDRVYFGLGWHCGRNGANYDLDGSTFLLGANGKVPDIDHVIYFNNKNIPYGIEYGGDDRSGSNDDNSIGGDQETIGIYLKNIPDKIKKIVLSVSIFEAFKKKQNFGQVSNAYIRVYEKDDITGAENELCRYNLTDNYSLFQSVLVAEVFKENNEWIFKATGEGVQGELDTIGLMYGI